MYAPVSSLQRAKDIIDGAKHLYLTLINEMTMRSLGDSPQRHREHGEERREA
jgi:hypothetical protein